MAKLFRIFTVLLILLLLAPVAFGQSFCRADYVMTITPNGGYGPAPGTKVTVQTVSTPPTNVLLYDDPELTRRSDNPLTTDAAGRYHYCTNGGLTVRESWTGYAVQPGAAIVTLGVSLGSGGTSGSGVPLTLPNAGDFLNGYDGIRFSTDQADWNFLKNKPTVWPWTALSGAPPTFPPSVHTHPWSAITATPTTLAGFGITDAAGLNPFNTHVSATQAHGANGSVVGQNDLTLALTAKADVTALNTHVNATNNPHSTTAAQVGAIPVTDKIGGGAKVPTTDAGIADGCAQFSSGKLASTGEGCGLGAGGTSDHSLLTHLDFATAGHTGFQASLGYTPLNPANNLSDLGAVATARTNLGLGTAAVQNIPVSGNAASTEVVKGSDTRLADARTPLTHSHNENDVVNLVSDLGNKESTANKSATTTLGTSNTLYPTQNAVKTYVDTVAATKAATTASTTVNGQSCALGGTCTITASVAPSGSGTELQYKNGAALGAISGSSWDGTTLSVPNLAVGAGAASVINVTSLTVAQLQAVSTKTTGDHMQVSDGATAADCATGSGTNVHWCYWTGTSWASEAVASVTPAGSSGDLQTNNGSGALGSVPQSTFLTPAAAASAYATKTNPAFAGQMTYTPVTVSAIGAGATNAFRLVSDGLTASDCTSGGGSNLHWCWYNGTAWVASASSGGALNVNGSLVTNPNFNAATPAPDSGNTAVVWKCSGSNCIAQLPIPAAPASPYTGGAGTLSTFSTWVMCATETFNVSTVVSGVAAPTLQSAMFSLPAYWHAIGFTIEETSTVTSGSGQVTGVAASIVGNSGNIFAGPFRLMGASTPAFASYGGGFYSTASTVSGTQTVSLQLDVTNANPGNLSGLTGGAITVRACGVTLQ